MAEKSEEEKKAPKTEETPKPTTKEESAEAWGGNAAPGAETTPSDVLKRNEEKK